MIAHDDATRRRRALTVLFVILTVAWISTSSPIGLFLRDASAAPQDEYGTVPVYQFETQFIQHWLELGPLLTDDEPVDPERSLSDPVEGQEVEMKSGEKVHWHRVSLVPPETYLRPSKSRKLAYMFCKIKKNSSMASGLKQFYFGSDDAGKVWLDNELVTEFNSRRWHSPFSNPFLFEVSDREINCLLELRDMGGDHSFSLGAGFSFRGRCLCLDASTPQKNISASLILDGTSVETAWSESTGLFEIKMVPYAADTHLVLTSGKRRIRWPTEGSLQLRDGIADIPLPVANKTRLVRYSAREGFPSGAIEAIAEMPDGRIIASATNVAFVFDGQHAVEKYRLPDDCVISGIAVADNGTAWLGTRNSGLYFVQDDELPVRFAERTIGQCVYDIALDASGSLWVSSGIDDLKNLHNSSLSSEIHQIDNHHSLHQKNIGNDGIIIDIACHATGGVAFAQIENPIFILGNDGEIETVELWPTMKKNLVSSITFDPLGQLWVNRTQDVGYFQPSGEWKVISVPYSVSSHMPRNRICIDIQGQVWLTKTNWLFQIQDDQPVFFGKTGISREICATRNGSVYVATSEGVSKIVTPPVKRIDHRYGMTILSPTRIESLGDSVLVSGIDGSMQVKPDGTSTWIDDRFVINSPWGSRYRFQNGLLKYCRGDVDTTVRPVELFPDNTERVVDLLPTVLALSVCYFSEHLDYGLLAQNGHIFELRGNQVTWSGLLIDFPMDVPPKPIMDIVFVPPNAPNAGYWIARDDRSVLWKKEDGSQVFELDSVHNQAHRFFRRSNGDLLVATAKGVRRVDTERGELVEDAWMDRFSKYDVVDIAESNSGMLWIATQSSGIYGERNGIWSSLDTVELLQDIHIFDIEIDALENLWIAAAEGLHVFTPNHIPPTVSIDSIASGDYRLESFSLSDPPLVYLDDSFVVRLAGVDDISPSTSFRFRSDGPWQQAPLHQDSLTFRLESRGDHLIEFQAVDQDANVSLPVSLLVRAKLHYWQTAWFRISTTLLGIGSILLIVGMIVVLNRSRIEKRRVQKELFQEQRKAKEFAEVATQEKVMLLARVCHDLRSPLSIVQLCLERDVNSQAEAEQIRKLLGESASQMTYLTDQLLTYSATENPRDLKKEVVEIAEFLSLIESSTSLRLADSPVQFRIEITPTAPKWLRLDRRRITEVMNNLTENSIRYTQSGLIVLAYTTRHDGCPQFRLSDTGSGMSEATLGKVLTPFFRDSKSSHATSGNNGVGLGLAICSSLVRQMEGKFEIKSEMGIGTEVSITLPQTVISDGNGCIKKTNGRVFVIDSNSSQRRSLRQLLNSIGWKCETGDESLNVEIIRQFKPDVVIIDMIASNESALAFTKKLRGVLGSHVILIAMSNPANLIHSSDTSLFDHLVDKARVFQSNTDNLVHLMATSRE